jgi:hypothetical protein
MANKLYPRFKETLLKAGVDLTTATIKVVLVDTGGYTQTDTHQFLSSVPSAARVGTPVGLASKTVALGVFDADDVTFTSVPAGTGSASAEEALVIYRDTGVEATSDLIAYIDTATGLPVSPNGGNIVITWDAAGILSL